MKRIGIIGATGAIGTALIEKCVEEAIEVYAFVRPDSERGNRIPKDKLVHIIPCDMNDMATFFDVSIPKLDVFYYFAWAGTHGTDARNNIPVQIHNIQYTIDAVELAKRLGCNTFIGAGSQAEYGRKEGILRVDTPCNPENGYGMAKHAAGNLSRIRCNQLGLRHIWCRILSVYGPRDGYHSMVSFAIRECVEGRTPKFTKGEQLWDYIYSKDAGEAFYLMGKKGKDGAIYVLGSGEVRPLKEFISCICEYANPNVTPEFGAIPYMDKQVMYLQADISALQEDTGFLPRTKFLDGIKETIDWYKMNNFGL